MSDAFNDTNKRSVITQKQNDDENTAENKIIPNK